VKVLRIFLAVVFISAAMPLAVVAVGPEPDPANDDQLILVEPSGGAIDSTIPTTGPDAENILCREGVPVVGGETCEGVDNTSSTSGLLTLFDNLMGGLTRLAAAIAVIIIIVSGIRYATSGGDPQGVASARSAIIYALVALIVAVSTEIIIDFVLRRIS